MKYFIGFDIGTQSSKGLLISPDGLVVAEATMDYLPIFPKPGWAEDDPANWIAAFRKIIAELKAKSGVKAKEIGAIGFASQCGGIVPVDEYGNALSKCIIWLDCRSEPQYKALSEKISDEEALYIVGSHLNASMCITKIMWVKENMPAVYEKAKAFLQPGEFMVSWLTGNMVGDFAHASMTMMYDVVNKKWSERMLEAAGIDIEKMYPIVAAADVAGTIKKALADELGLDANTKIVVGTGDEYAGFLGCGLAKPGKTMNISGTAEIVAAVSEKVVFDESGIIWTHLHPDPKYYGYEQGVLVSGGCLRWYKDTIARCSFEEIGAGAANVPVGSEGLLFLPYLQGAITPKANPSARGVFFGLTMNHSIDHMSRAVYEGVTFSFRDCIEVLDSMGGIAGDGVIVGGGGAKSSFWCQMKADMTGKSIQALKSKNPTAIGAAILAGVAQGNFSSLSEAADKMVELGRIYEPNLKLKAAYDEAYGFYRYCIESFEKPFSKYLK